MKVIYSALLLLTANFATAGPASAQSGLQDSTGLPGDHFSLEGALDLFKASESPEAFETKLNSEESKVNNLDLNQDGNTDYIRVINKKGDNVQIFILQALVSENESQDIAVIELEKTGKDEAQIQITGDEDIYGENIIIEPSGDDQSVSYYPYSFSDRNIKGPYAGDFVNPSGVVVNVWFWPSVRFVFAPGYNLWVSPWTWHRRPLWYRPWRPLGWYAYRPIRLRYHAHYVIAPTRRIIAARAIYRPVRVTSVTVTSRNRTAVNNYRVSRNIKTTTVTGPRGRQHRVTQRTTTVQGPRGNTVQRKSTKVRRSRR